MEGWVNLSWWAQGYKERVWPSVDWEQDQEYWCVCVDFQYDGCSYVGLEDRLETSYNARTNSVPCHCPASSVLVLYGFLSTLLPQRTDGKALLRAQVFAVLELLEEWSWGSGRPQVLWSEDTPYSAQSCLRMESCLTFWTWCLHRVITICMKSFSLLSVLAVILLKTSVASYISILYFGL